MIDFIRGLKLSFSEWAALVGAALVGLLVAAFRAQGRQLHKAQVQILEQRLDARSQQDAKDTTKALAAYDKAKEAYKAAGGTLLLLVALCAGPSSLAEQPDPARLLPACQVTLGACNTAVEVQKNEIAGLKKDVETWKKEVHASNAGPSFLLPVLVGTAAGGVGGFAANNSKGVVTGSVVGALVGLAAALLNR